jgi:hypothetical protein
MGRRILRFFTPISRQRNKGGLPSRFGGVIRRFPVAAARWDLWRSFSETSFQGEDK